MVLTNLLKEKNTTFDFFYLFIIVFLFNIFFISLIYYIYDKPFFEEKDLNYFSVRNFFMYVLILPLIEEFAFRGFFSFSNKYMIFFSLLSLSLIIFVYLGGNLKSYSLFSVIILVGYFLIFNEKNIILFNQQVLKNFLPLLFVSSFLFSIAHLKNYENFNIETCLKIIPRFIGGVYFGYIAFKYNITKSYLLHSLNNLIPFLYLAFKIYRF